MTINRWWHTAVLVLTGVLGALMLLSELTPGRLSLGLVSIAVFLISWALLARRAFRGGGPALALSLITVIVTGAGTAAEPSFATFQCVGYPLIWVLAKNTRQAILANVALALAVGVGFLFSRPLGAGTLLEITLTVLLSLAFSLALGFWITRIQTLSEQRQSLVDELRVTQQKLAAVSRDAGVTAERQRLARELHDTIAQDLTGLVMLAQRARGETDAAARDRQLAQLEENARDALSETRALVADGAPAALDGGLPAALDRLAARFTRDTGIDIKIVTDEVDLDRDSQVVVLRCTQEALANVRRHSAATSAKVTLQSGMLTVTDNGNGFDVDSPTIGFGLCGMRDRLALVGGNVDVVSGPSGTRLTIRLAGARA